VRHGLRGRRAAERSLPPGEYTLSLELTWTNPESRKRFEEFVAKHGSENVELCDPKLPRTQDKVDLHLAAPLG
jgi:hypothetical protein